MLMLNPISSEQLLDMETKKKRKVIAGIDQEELVDPKLLADLDSCFCEFKGVQIHHKIYDAAESQAQNTFQNQCFSSNQEAWFSYDSFARFWSLGFLVETSHEAFGRGYWFKSSCF